MLFVGGVDFSSVDNHIESQVVVPRSRMEFVDMSGGLAQGFGLPRSVGEIYGLLFISPEPLPLDVIVSRLEISKGSVSQGLRFLRNLGAVKPVYVSGDRRDHFTAVAELKKLANGFIRGELNPNLESATIRLDELKSMARNDVSPNSDFFKERIRRIGNWRRRGGMLLKIVNRFLGRTT